jgi:membrane-bound lytic murein transglycosylase MltF
MGKIGYVLLLVIGILLVAAVVRKPVDPGAQVPTSNAHPATETTPDPARQDASAPEESPVPLARPSRPLDYLEQVTMRQRRSFSEMRDRNVIRALVTHSKTFYFFDGATQRGLSYDALRAFETYLNKELKTKTIKMRIVFIPVTRDQLLPALEAGYGDLAVANLTITPERQQDVDFSRPVIRDVHEIVVTGIHAPPVEKPQDLSGRTVHTRASSSYYESLLTLNAELQAKGLAPANIVKVDEHLEDEDLLEMVNAELIDIIVMDSHKAQFWEQIFPDIRLHNEVVLRSGGSIGWAVRKGSPELKKMVDDFLRRNGQGTLLGNILLKRYLKENVYIRNNLASPELEKFHETAHLVQKYADRYDFDWLMVMSQAYQESKLDHSARSHTGAVGIMQMLPSTAADKNVAIPDIEDLENNIHAGNKYLRFIRDRYFDDEPMTELNKTLFSFAAYNAGPAKIARLRREAERQGLDPNVWFDNVEIIAARRIGRETVQYVSNIYKYWVAYRLSKDALVKSLAQAA